jgi:hypothetical protein
MAKHERLDWEALIREHEKSGKSVQEFCKEKQIHSNTFYVNRKKLRDVVDFVEIAVSETTDTPSSIILTYKDAHIEVRPGFCRKTLHELFLVLGERTC